MLSENPTCTNRHLQVDGLPNECKIKKRRSKELMMLATSKLIGGADGGLGTAQEGGGPLYSDSGPSILLPDKTRICLSSSVHRNRQISLFNSANVGKWKLR